LRRYRIELAVGVFMIVGIICLGYLSIRMGQMELVGGEGYELEAVFSDCGGLKSGSSVVIAGVEVGRVKQIRLDDYQARVVMNLAGDVGIQEDAIASIKTRGLIGEKYVDISAGGSEKILEPGARIRDTQPAVDLEGLISNFVFGKL